MIRPAQLADAAGIAHVHVHSWKETYVGMVAQSYLDSLSVEQRTERWVKILTANTDTTFVAEEDGRIVGFVYGGKPQMPELGFASELYALYVLKSHQKTGLGKQLFESFYRAMTKAHPSFYLWVIDRNPTARFYARMGGIKGQSKTIEIGGAQVVEDLYSWRLG